MITLSTLIIASLSSPVLAEDNVAIIDPVIQATTTTEMSLAGPELPPVVAATPEVSAEPVGVETVVRTPIDWGADGGTTVTAEEATVPQNNPDMGMVMFPLAAALFAGAWFFKKKVFSAVAANKNEDPINIVSRKTIAGQASVVLVDVTAADGTTRRLLLGSGDKGVNLVADISPIDSIFPEQMDVFEPNIEPKAEPAPTPKQFAPQSSPATVSQLSAQALRDDQQTAAYGQSRSNANEMPRFRKKRGYNPPVLAADIETTTAEEKRRAAQAVLDEVLAERKNDQGRGSRIRITA